MGLFKKKNKVEPVQAPAQEESNPQRQAVKTFAEDFLSEEIELLAVTGPSGVSYEQDEASGLWHVCYGLTAWTDKYADEIEMGNARLEALLDDSLLEFLLGRIPRNFVISVNARPNEDGTRFLMTELPSPTFDPDLKAIADAQKQPITIEVDGLGTFTLNRNLGWYESLMNWAGKEITLTFDQDPDGLAGSQDTARALMAEPEQWDSRMCCFAADTLLEKTLTFLEEGETFAREDFLAKLECDSILASPDGAFEAWFGGEDVFMLHPVHVTGTLADGPTFAEIEE